MNLENIVAISGMSGLYKAISSRTNGLVVEEFDNKKKLFVSTRQHQFTPLETISIYTYEDSVGLKQVFSDMYALKDQIPANALKTNAKDLESFIRLVIPQYDEDRVSVGDMKKLVKWFQFLVKNNLITDDNYLKIEKEPEVENSIKSSEEE